MQSVLFTLFFFTVSFGVDVVWARYTQHVSRGSRFEASNYALLIALAGMVSWFAYHHSLWYVIPVALGSWLGTYFGMKKDV